MTDETLEQIQESKAAAEPAEMPTEEPVAPPVEEPIDETKLFGEVLTKANGLLEKDFGSSSLADSIEVGIVSKEAVKQMLTDWGKKYLGEMIKITTSFPYILKINQEALKELVDKYSVAEEKDKKGIRESIYGTITQIESTEAQVTALEGMMDTYKEILKALSTL